LYLRCLFYRIHLIAAYAMRSLVKLNANCICSAPGSNCYNAGKSIFLLFIERHFTNIGKTLYRFTVSHEFPDGGGGQDISVTLKFISEFAVFFASSLQRVSDDQGVAIKYDL
jgi:hypothetical protein